MKTQFSPFWSMSAKAWAALILTVLVVLGIFSLIEIITFNHNVQVDLTIGKQFSLSEQSIKILKSLKKDIKFVVFHEKSERWNLENLIQQFRFYSPKIKYQLIDLDRNPVKAESYGIKGYGETVCEYDGKRKLIIYPTEEKLINAILALSQEKKRVIYYTKGHGEKDPFDEDKRKGYSEIKSALETEGYQVKTLWLMGTVEIPDDASIVIVAGPKKDFLKHEIDQILSYLHRGGKVAFMLEPFLRFPYLDDFLSKFDIILPEGIIIDKGNKLFGGDCFSPFIPLYSRHPITENLKSPAVFSSARIVDVKRSSNLGRSFAKTSPQSWCMVNAENIRKGKIEFIKGVDMDGPLSVAVIIDVDIPGTDTNVKLSSGSMVCFGDSDFINNFFVNTLGNKDLFLNTVAWLCEERDLISVRPKKIDHPYHFMSSKEARWFFWVPVIFQPAILLVIGVVVFIQRHRRG